MKTTTDIFAAGMDPHIVAINHPEIFMGLFWDTYSSRLPNNPQDQGEQGSSSSSQTSFPPNMSQDHLMALLMSQRAREQEHQRLPPMNFDANPNVFNFDEVASMLPMAGSSSCHQRKANSKQQHLVSNDTISSLGASSIIPPEPTHAPRLTQQIEESQKPMDEDIASFSSSDDSSDDSMDITYMQTSARKQEQQQDFPFGLVTSIQPSDNKLSCCDFSSQGKFLAAAGHEKKVFIWNVGQATSNAIPIQYMIAMIASVSCVKIWK